MLDEVELFDELALIEGLLDETEPPNECESLKKLIVVDKVFVGLFLLCGLFLKSALVRELELSEMRELTELEGLDEFVFPTWLTGKELLEGLEALGTIERKESDELEEGGGDKILRAPWRAASPANVPILSLISGAALPPTLF